MTNDRTSDTPRTDEVTSWEWTPGLPAFTQLDSHYDKLAERARELGAEERKHCHQKGSGA